MVAFIENFFSKYSNQKQFLKNLIMIGLLMIFQKNKIKFKLLLGYFFIRPNI